MAKSPKKPSGNELSPRQTVNEVLSNHIARIEKMQQRRNRFAYFSSQSNNYVLRNSPNSGILKVPIPFELHEKNLFFATQLRADVQTPMHSHDESVFRFVASGALEVTYKRLRGQIETVLVFPGEWFVIFAGTEYSIRVHTPSSNLEQMEPGKSKKLLKSMPSGTSSIEGALYLAAYMGKCPPRPRGAGEVESFVNEYEEEELGVGTSPYNSWV